MHFTPKTAWESVKVLAGGKTSHHKAPTVMRLKLPSGKLATTDAENVSIMGPHLEKVFTNHRPIDWPVLLGIDQRSTLLELDANISWEELRRAITKLANGKSPGLNDVPPDAFKALTVDNLKTLLDFLNSFWDDEVDFEEWHEGQMVPVPKSGDLSDPSKWRGVTLMDLGSKIFSSIMCTRLFRIIDKHGVKYQFGSTPGVGCQDGSFTIKTMLHLQHNHNLPTWVMFADLVKAFDTSNHVLMIKILRRYGCPPKLCSAIERMYSNNTVRLIIGKIDISIPFEVGVKQGDSVAPVLFLFLMMAFAETIEKEWDKHDIQRIEFKRHDNSPHSAGRLTSHPAKNFS